MAKSQKTVVTVQQTGYNLTLSAEEAIALTALIRHTGCPVAQKFLQSTYDALLDLDVPVDGVDMEVREDGLGQYDLVFAEDSEQLIRSLAAEL